MILASSIIDRCSKQLLDITNVRWSRDQLLDWLSVGQRFIVVLQPSSSSTTVTRKLDAGTLQEIPPDGWLLLDVIRNMGTTGTTPGRAVRVVSRRLMDAYNPLWHSSPASATTQNYIFDPQSQTSFYVYPPSNGLGYLQYIYAALPAQLTSESDPITLPDAYEEALNHYVMFRALSKNAEFAGSPQAEQYLALFNTSLGAKATAEQANNPNIGLAPPNPTANGGVS